MAKRKKTEPAKPRKRVKKTKSRVVPQIVDAVAELTEPLEAAACIVPQDAVVVMPPAAEDVHVTPVLDCEEYHQAEVVVTPPLAEVEKPKMQDDTGESYLRHITIAGVVVFLAALLMFAIGSCTAHGAEPVHPYTAARTQAMQSGKPLVVLLESDGCLPCKKLMAEHGVQIRAKGVFVDLNWERDQRVIGRIVPPGRVTFPSLFVWQRGPGGNWVKVEIQGAADIRAWAKGEKR